MGPFAAKFKAAGMRIDTTNSYVSCDKLEESLYLKCKSISQVREGWIGRLTDESASLSKVMCSMYWSVEVKRKLSDEVHLSIYWSMI